MTLSDIDVILQEKQLHLDESIKFQITTMKEDAIQSGNENLANILWCYERIYKIQQLYLNTYGHLRTASLSEDKLIDEYDSMKSREYEIAWNEMDQCDINMSFLEGCFCIPDRVINDYHIDEIINDIKRLQPLFPYRVFCSRETVVKEQKCSICGRIVSVRHSCGHIPGKLYMGKMCGREITDLEFLSETLVSKPFDKYAILKVKGQKLNFHVLDYIVPHIQPYCKWSYTVEKKLLPQFVKIGRNEKCPCGSGMKYKFCVRRDPSKHYEDHYKVSVDH